MGNVLTRTIGGAPQSYAYGRPPEVITSTLPPGLPHRTYLPIVVKRFGPESPPPATYGQPFAVISTTAGFRATYDRNGNMTLRVENGVTYQQQFDAENRLSVVTDTVTGQVTRFAYDGDGNRVLRTDGSGTMACVGGYYEQNVTTGVATAYYYLGSQRIAMRVSDSGGSTVTYLHGDHLGSTSLTTDGGGAKAARVLYHPYGEERYREGTLPTDFTYTGQRVEPSLGLMDYRARYYSPSLGRFISADRG